MALVMDASVAVKWLVKEDETEAARALVASPESLIAPDWVIVEVCHGMWKKVVGSQLLASDARHNLDILPPFRDRLYSASELIADAFHCSFRTSHSVYDCLYLALALREECKLVTADRRFRAALARVGMSDIEQPL